MVLAAFILLLVGSWLILRSPVVQTWLVQKITSHFSEKLNTTISIKGVSVSFFNKVIIEEVLVNDQEGDSLLFVHDIKASIESISLKRREIGISKFELNKTHLNIKTDSAGQNNYQFILDAFSQKDPTPSDSLRFNFLLKKFEFNDARMKVAFHDSEGPRLLDLQNISIGISDVEIQKDKTAFLIDQFQFSDHSDFHLKEFSASFFAAGDSVKLTDIHVHTSNSEITKANIRLKKKRTDNGLNLNKTGIDIELRKSVVSLKDVGMMVPELKGMDETIEVSGQVTGTLADLKGKNIELSMGENTRLAFDIYLNGLPDLASTYMHIDLKQSFADFNDIANVKLPEGLSTSYPQIPGQLLQAGIIEYKGNFTGFIYDFVAFGTFRSRWGVLTTDLSFVPSEGEKLAINGSLRTINFKIGKVFNTEILDGITFNGNVKGILNKLNNDFSAKISGKIDSVYVNDYQYRNINLSGDVLNKKFDGSLLIDDPNLQLRFAGKMDFNVRVPVFNFDMLLEKADLKAMNLDKTYKTSEISFALNANFTGNSIDNLDGLIHFTKGNYVNENDTVEFDNFDLRTFYDKKPVLQVRSDFLDADISGQYELHKLHNSFKKIVSAYLPSVGMDDWSNDSRNNFDFNIVLKDINRFTRALKPDLMIQPATITGSINSEANKLMVDGKFPEIKYQSTTVHNYSLSIDGNSTLSISNKVKEVSIGETFKIQNLSLVSEASSDLLESKLDWDNLGKTDYSGSINTSARFFRQLNSPHIEIFVKPSKLYIADSLWQINSALITVDSTFVKIDKLKISNKSQFVMADGLMGKDQSNKLNIAFNQLELNSLNNFIKQKLYLKGNLNGNLTVMNVYKLPLVLADLQLNNLGLLHQNLGTASIITRWDPTWEEIDAQVNLISENRETMKAVGIYNPAKDSISIFTEFNQFSLLIMQPLLGSSFSNIHGNATGKVHIHGSSDFIKHDGALFASNAGLMLTELRVNYNFSDSVRFAGDKMIFPMIRITDDYGNVGFFNGSIKHRNFSKMVYDLSVRTDNIMAINTTSANNEQFYGKLFGSGNLRITGKGANVYIDGIAKTMKGTEMNIFLEYAEEAQEYDFLTFVTRGKPIEIESAKIPVSNSNIEMKFNVEITPEAKAQLIYNSKVGDVIRSQGSGNMRIEIDNKMNISLFGEYTVDQGDYLFTLQNVINKKFEIQQGGTIQWNGDPLNAIIDLNAIYRLKASLSELFANSADDADYTQRIPVLCKIALTNNLSNPDIKFDIELPSAESRVNDELRQYISSEEDMNKQILSLLVLGKFYTPEYLRGNFSALNNNLVGSTASELLSNQFSNWLSQINNDFDIGFNYRPGNQITNDEVELALGTQIFNDRVSINGNIGNNASQRASANNSGLVGDADIKVKLTRNGKLQLKAYNHANNNLIYETSPYTQGVGISYREDFDTFNELWEKVRSIFKRKKIKTETVD